MSKLPQGRKGWQPVVKKLNPCWRGRLAMVFPFAHLCEYLVPVLVLLLCEQPVEGAQEEGEKRKFGEVKIEAGWSALDKLPGLERVRFSQEGVTVKIEV